MGLTPLQEELKRQQEEAIRRAKAARAAIPKMLRQYAKRYAKKSPEDILATHAKYRVPMLNHGRDRADALRKLLARAAKVPA